MTPESIPGKLVPDGFDDLFGPLADLPDIDGPMHHGPAYRHHELLLTDLSEAA